MKKVFAAAVLLAAQFALTPQLLAAEEKKPTPQQQRMKDCNADAKAKELKGDERKSFMKGCLSGKQTEAKDARSAQQEKMKACNADAKTKELKGAERKAFMSDCLKN
ncbi:MAG: PsiF family protein [Rhodocyclaceae bacterium]|nr:PsiF family protein [Rhodocyclaceae bacterium]MDZ4216271.1 PsiF family protein [Rhodocyclaceae bacterium]